MTATQLKRVQNSSLVNIKQEQIAVRKLLRGYLHKTSNSLCGIRGYADLIAEKEVPNSLTAQWANKILAEIERMEEIFHSVGDMTMTSRTFKSGCNLPGVMHQTKLQILDNNPCMEIEITALPHGQLLLPEADLNLVIKEILTNSVEANPEVEVQINGQISITGRVVLCIADNGPGMSPELLKQATDPFVTTREKNIGVGLTRVETILDMHGLAWSMTSRSGLGTTITMEVAEAINWESEIV